MRAQCLRRIKGMFSLLGVFLLAFNIVGFLGGFLLIHRPVRRHQVEFSSNRKPTERSGVPSRTTTLPLHLQNRLSKRPSDGQTPLSFLNIAHEKGTTLKSRSPPAADADLHPPNSPCLYSEGRGFDDGAWYDFSDHSLRFYAYSAFYDDRPSIGSDHVVRIIALSSKFENDLITNRLKTTLYCAYRYKDVSSPPDLVPMDPVVGPIGYGWTLHQITLKEYIFTCPLHRKHPLPVAVTVVTEPSRLSTVTSCLPVEVPPKPETKRDFAVCVQVSYGQLDPHRLIEWLELQRILGVSRVGVYDMTIGAGPGLDVLRHYAGEGLVELRKTNPLPIPGIGQYMIHGSPVINDCMYRNMHAFKWTLVIDFDEAVVPRKHKNLKDMASELESKTSGFTPAPVTFLFMNQYFFTDSEPDPNESPNYTILRYRNKAPLSPQGYAMKSYVNPMGCQQMHNHYCMGVTKGFKGDHKVEFVHESIASNQHYKKCHFNPNECQAIMRNSTKDDVMMTYAVELKMNAEKKRRTILKT